MNRRLYGDAAAIVDARGESRSRGASGAGVDAGSARCRTSAKTRPPVDAARVPRRTPDGSDRPARRGRSVRRSPRALVHTPCCCRGATLLLRGCHDEGCARHGSRGGWRRCGSVRGARSVTRTGAVRRATPGFARPAAVSSSTGPRGTNPGRARILPHTAVRKSIRGFKRLEPWDHGDVAARLDRRRRRTRARIRRREA